MKTTTKILENASELFAGIFIVLVFTAIGVGTGLAVNYFIGGIIGITAGSVVGIVVLFIGVRIVVMAYRKKGTMFILSRTMATPELDSHEKEEEESE